MRIDSLATTVQDALTARRVFAEPYERDGVTVIAAALVSGGAGGGGGSDEKGGEGDGGGLGVKARPAGAYVIKEGRVSWRPAVDMNRLMAALAVVTVTYLVTRARLEKARLKAAARQVG